MVEYGIVSISALSTATGNFELGWVFKVGNEDIVISGLRVRLPNINTRRINLWSNNNINLANVTVTSIVGEWVEGQFNTPITLLANTQYKITVFNDLRYQSSSPTSFVYNSKIIFITGCGGTVQNGAPSFTENKQYPLVDIVIGEDVKPYNTSGTFITPPIDTTTLPINPRIKYENDLPEGTSISVGYAINHDAHTIPEIWTIVNNGNLLAIPDFTIGFLWLKYTLTTTDNTVTPTLQRVWIEDAEIPQDKILLTMEDIQGRFPTVEGDLIVEYDASKGNLTGQGGAVDSFVVIFTPTDLAPEHNPGIIETITGAPTISIDYLEVTYHKGYANETITAAAAEITVAFLHTDVINP